MKKRNSENEKLTDKAFSRLIFTSVIAILACVVCLCSTTYAWFTDAAPSNSNQINIAEDCLLSVVVTGDGVTLDNIEDGVELEALVDYVVMLSLPANTASGYCVIDVDGETYRTDYILRHEQAEAQTIELTLRVEAQKTVKFTSRWGVYTGEGDVGDGETLLIP